MYRKLIKTVREKGSISLKELSYTLRMRQVDVECLVNKGVNDSYLRKYGDDFHIIVGAIYP